MLKELGRLDLPQRRKHLRLALFYKVVNDLIAVPHEDILTPIDTRIRERGANDMTYRELNYETDGYQYSFFVNTIVDWNDLSSEIVQSETVDSFKEGLYRAARPTANTTLAASQLAGRPEPACCSRV